MLPHESELDNEVVNQRLAAKLEPVAHARNQRAFAPSSVSISVSLSLRCISKEGVKVALSNYDSDFYQILFAFIIEVGFVDQVCWA